MERFYYESPSLDRKEDAINYIEEFINNNSKIHGVGGLNKKLDRYEEWLNDLEQYKTIEPGEKLVPAETFFLVRESDNRIIGMSNIRLCLNKSLSKSGGHIGYSIRPTERRKGYNKINLYLALQVCKEHNIKEALLTCDKDNLGSARTMQALDGKLIDEFIEDNILEQNYIIDVNSSLENHKAEYTPKILKQR